MDRVACVCYCRETAVSFLISTENPSVERNSIIDTDTDLHGLFVEANTILLAGINKLLNEADACYRDLADQRVKMRDVNATKFNIFTLTERSNFEVTTHQRILADLLNPFGSHQQGNFFLKPFLDVVAHATGIALAPANGLWEVGRANYIDVRVKHPDSGERLIIETKWNADDYEGQVDGYWRAERQRPPRRQRIPVVFLTKTGCKPRFGGEVTDQALFDRDLVCLSYGRDVASILEGALGCVKAPRVLEVLRQYIDLLKDIPMQEGDEQ